MTPGDTAVQAERPRNAPGQRSAGDELRGILRASAAFDRGSRAYKLIDMLEAERAEGDAYRDALGRLVGAVRGIDLADARTLEQCPPRAELRATRPAWLWRELAQAFDHAEAALCGGPDAEAPSRHADVHRCADCRRPTPHAIGSYWLAPDGLWARVVGDDSIVLCPGCFHDRADAKGICVSWRAVEDQTEAPDA